MQFRIADLTSSALTVRVSIYFSLFCKGSREGSLVASLASSTSDTIKFVIKSGSDSLHCTFLSTQSVGFNAVVGVQSVTLTTDVELLTDTQAIERLKIDFAND
jgi:hypothetical protein